MFDYRLSEIVPRDIWAKKNASMSVLALYFNYFNYCFGVSTGLAGAGVAVFGAATSLSSIIFELLSLIVPVKLKLDNKINIINIVANVHVALFKKSFVF